MKNSNEAIDRVLTGLRDICAPDRMDQRVLAAMERRAAERSGWQWRSWPVGLAAATVVVAAMVFSLRPHKIGVETVAAGKPALSLRIPGPVVDTQRRNTGVLHVAQNGLNRRVLIVATSPPVKTMDTVGIPAPPMPLTQQERLLLRLAHRADATELAPLNAEVRARQGAEFDAEFQEFFAPPVTAVNDTNSTEKEKGATQ